ncbi:MAG: hypothetical protein HRT46_06115 [Deltaproteobacteria bacterium]|nr:hypothetical protein [Deltaproteobacteria bacterium]
MLESVASGCLVFLSLSLLVSLYRVVRGPSVADRVVAAGTMTTSVLAVVVVGAILADSRDYTDTVMALAVVSFFGTAAFARYLVRGRLVD